MPMDFDEEVSAIVRIEDQKQRSFFFFSTLALATTIGIFGVLGGFVYGDYYGRKHAQFDNQELRQHYAGQCYSFIETTLTKTIKESLDKTSGKREQMKRLDDIKAMMTSLQLDIAHLSGPKAAPRKAPKNDNPFKKKVASAR